MIVLLIAVIFGLRVDNPYFKTWGENRKRFPQVVAAAKRYRKKDEEIGKFLPELVIDGKSYFVIMYTEGEYNSAPVTGILVIDKQGGIVEDEDVMQTISPLLTRIIHSSYPIFRQQNKQVQRTIRRLHKQVKAFEQAIDLNRSRFEEKGAAVMEKAMVLKEKSGLPGEMLNLLSELYQRRVSRWQEYANKLTYVYEAYEAELTEYRQHLEEAGRRFEALEAALQETVEIAAELEQMVRKEGRWRQKKKLLTGLELFPTAAALAGELTADMLQMKDGIDEEGWRLYRERLAYARQVDREWGEQ